MAIGMNQVFEWAPNVMEAQIRQERVDAIDVLIVPGVGYSKTDEAILEREFRARLGQEIAIRYHPVESIPRNRERQVSSGDLQH